MAKLVLAVPIERIQRMIYLMRGEKVMLDSDLAGLYGVETGALNRAVRRNLNRFPGDFMFQLDAEETENLRCQFGISSSRYGGRRYRPYAFTEQGVAMLSSVLRSERAVQMNVAIMRASSSYAKCWEAMPNWLANSRNWSSAMMLPFNRFSRPFANLWNHRSLRTRPQKSASI